MFNYFFKKNKSLFLFLIILSFITTLGLGLHRPINNSFKMTEGVWEYKNNNIPHYGIDLAAPFGSNVYAPLDGIVTFVSDGCNSYGNLSDKCNGGFGNYITLIGKGDDNKSYGFLYAHLKQYSINVKIGTPVLKGDIIGQVGSSGMSTGSHLHIEMIYLGNNNLKDLYNNLRLKKNFNFLNSANMRCKNNNFKAPCRLNPAHIDYFNFSINRSY